MWDLMDLMIFGFVAAGIVFSLICQLLLVMFFWKCSPMKEKKRDKKRNVCYL